MITYYCLAYVSVVTHHLPHTLASFVSIPVDRVTLVLLWISVDAGTGYATEVWENLMNAFSMQFLKQPLLYRYAAEMLIQVDLIVLPCLLSLYVTNVVEPCLYAQNCDTIVLVFCFLPCHFFLFTPSLTPCSSSSHISYIRQHTLQHRDIFWFYSVQLLSI